MTTNYVIYIRTNEREYKEYCYSLMETIERIDCIRICDNVNLIDVVDYCTGEVMITIENSEIEYVATEVPIRLYDEIIIK